MEEKVELRFGLPSAPQPPALSPATMSFDAPAGVTRPVCFLDIQIGETAAGRIKIELFSDVVPKCVLLACLRTLG